MEEPTFDIDWEKISVEELEEITSTIDKLEEEVTSEESRETTNRFPEVSDEKMDLILEDAQAKGTKYATNYHIRVFKEWASVRGITTKLEDMENQELDGHLRKFYAETRNKKGEEYSRSTLLGLRNSVERYLNNPPFKRGIKIVGNPQFQISNQFLDARIKQLKQGGKEKIQHKPAIPIEDLKKVKESGVLKPSTPLGLLRNVWFHTTLFWCRRGREGQRYLSPSSFAFDKDPQGRSYATMTHNECTKNHPGGIKDVESFEKDGRMYETNENIDGYRALRLYISKLNPRCSSFFQYPRRQGWKMSDEVWFENRPLGVNKLGNMMSEISQEASTSRRYTNHSLRVTAITLWTEAGIPNRHIMAISGHRNEESLRHYNARPSTYQLENCSNVLSRALHGKENDEEAVSVHLTSRQEHNQQFSVQSTNNLRSFSGLFSSCAIENINITFQK